MRPILTNRRAAFSLTPFTFAPTAVARKRQPTGDPQRPGPKSLAGGQASAAAAARACSLGLRRVPGCDAWELVHPPCAEERADDLAEVEQMLDAGEAEIAAEELRWLLEGCRDLLAAHRLLGEIALEEGDAKLARAHFGYAFQLGVDALAQAGDPGPLPYERPANQGFFQAGKGLAWSFQQLGQPDKAREIAERLLVLDPADPLNLRATTIDAAPRQPPGG